MAISVNITAVGSGPKWKGTLHTSDFLAKIWKGMLYILTNLLNARNNLAFYICQLYNLLIVFLPVLRCCRFILFISEMAGVRANFVYDVIVA